MNDVDPAYDGDSRTRRDLTATPAHAEGVTVPTLVMAMTCWEFVVPAEVVLDHL